MVQVDYLYVAFDSWNCFRFCAAVEHAKDKLPPKREEDTVDENLEAELQKNLSEEARVAGFQIHPDVLATIIGAFEIKTLRKLKGVEGLAIRLNVSLSEGVKSNYLANRPNWRTNNEFPMHLKNWKTTWRGNLQPNNKL